MKIQLLFLVLALLALLLGPVDAELYYNRLPYEPEDIEKYGLKCIPGRTVIKVEEPKILEQNVSSEEEDTRRSHMNAGAKGDELCQICVCSVEGKDEYCSRRPARNVNECIRLAMLNEDREKNGPFSHERALSYRIRRDYIWHRDEIPYEAKASCKRGNSYYSNSVTANNTDIDVASDIDSLLDYSNKDICFYCVCSTDGRHAGCINRDPWFCEYYRIIRDPHVPRQKYRVLFKQDRPAYFRQLSYRLRRTMDEGLDSFLELGGDTLCCNHPDGHRRNLHEKVRNKIRLIRRKVPKENMMGVGDDNETSCVPFVSEYSDCSEANRCTGCQRCSCTAESEWFCETVLECPTDENNMADVDASNTLDILYSQLSSKKKPSYLVPPPPQKQEDDLIDVVRYQNEDFKSFLARQKRSVEDKSKINDNHTVKFYHTIDEINEDTLKDLNSTGTIPVQKVEINRVPKISRRTSMYDNFNNSGLNALHIEYNQPQDYDHHIAENKIEIQHGDNLEYNEDKLNKLLGNHSKSDKDKVLSKIVVNELKKGSEIIGDKNISPMSNITFTPENDTLTAMTYIAGNLLNKLWNMEMESTDFSIETEVLKHEKINDLLELFKEPLSMRQEYFIKNALEKLSDTLSKNKNVKNVSLCETIAEQSSHEESNKSGINSTTCTTERSRIYDKRKDDLPSPTTEAISKLNNVLDLIKKFESVQNNLNDLQSKTITKEIKLPKKLYMESKLNAPDDSSLKLFGNLLEKITKLLVPNKNNKKILEKLKELNQLKNNKKVKFLVKDKYKIEVSERDIGAKDKVVLDYLEHIENNPNCLFKKNLKNIEQKSTENVEGNTLYNLSEFLKVKSFIDLIKLLKPEMLLKSETKTRQEITTMLPETFTKMVENVSIDKLQRSLNSTKDKLKNHLKALLDDMIELQNVRGLNKMQSKTKIVDILPCIYNIMNGDTILNNEDNDNTQSSLSKIRNVLDTIKMELSSNSLLPTRRNNLITERPQSVKLWERVIKNVNHMQRKSRRNLVQTPAKSYEELKNIIEQVELVGNSYKNFAMLSVVPPQKQLMLLKTLEADTKLEKNALEAVINSMQTIINLPLDKRSEIKEFIDNAGNNINLSFKVLNNIDKTKQKIVENPSVEVFNVDQNKRPLEQDTQNMPEILARYKSNNNVRLTRDQIIKQLIIKRVEYYLKSREAVGINVSDDVNYNIGKRIILLMKTGNYNVAKELFKVFVANKRKDEIVRSQIGGAATLNEQRTKGRLLLALKDPLIRFDEQVTKPQDQDQILFKQLMNFKNLS